MLSKKLLAVFALAFIAVSTASKGPKDFGTRDRDTQSPGSRMRRPLPQTGRYPNIHPDDRGNYERSQTAANQCIDYYMYRLLFDESGDRKSNYRLAMEGCQERHGHLPILSEERRRQLQQKADDYTVYNGILPNEDYETMDPIDKEFFDEWMREVDAHCRETWGTIANRGPDQRVIREQGPRENRGDGGGGGGGGEENRQEFKLIPEAARSLRNTIFPSFRGARNPGTNNRARPLRQNNMRPNYFNFNGRPPRPI